MAAAGHHPISPETAPVRAVFFDLDDTLADHWHSSRRGLQAAARLCPALAARPADEIEKAYHRLLEELHARVLAGGLSAEESRRQRWRRLLSENGAGEAEPEPLIEAYRTAYLAARRPVPGALALLEALRGKAKIAVVTNHFSVSEQREKLRQCGLDKFVSALVVSAEAGAAKPDPAIFQLALRRAGCRAQEAVMVGDSWPADIAGALRAGLRAVWFNRFALPRPAPAPAAEIRAYSPAEKTLNVILCE